MLSRSRTLILVLALWQALAGFLSPMSLNVQGELGHIGLHWADQAHHHHDHDAGDWHTDDSHESLAHIMLDGLSGVMAHQAATSLIPVFAPGSSAIAFSVASWRSQWPDGLFRPPALLS